MNRLEAISRRGALVVAAIEGDVALEKCAASFGLIDCAEITEARRQAQKFLAEAEVFVRGLKKLENDIARVEAMDRRGRQHPRSWRRMDSIEVAQSAVFAELQHRRSQ